MCCNRRLSKTFGGAEDEAAIGTAMRALAEENDWHELPAVPGRRRDAVDICDACWCDIRDGESPDGAHAPSVFLQGMDDGEDHCTVCRATLEGDGGHTRQRCFEEGKSLGALDENLDCASKLAERIGCSVDYFHEVLERVPPAQRLPGKLHTCAVQQVELVFAHPKSREVGTETGLLLTVLAPMSADDARYTHEHMMLVKLRAVRAQVSIDDNGHACWSDDGVTCVLCQRDMTVAEEVALGG